MNINIYDYYEMLNFLNLEFPKWNEELKIKNYQINFNVIESGFLSVDEDEWMIKIEITFWKKNQIVNVFRHTLKFESGVLTIGRRRRSSIVEIVEIDNIFNYFKFEKLKKEFEKLKKIDRYFKGKELLWINFSPRKFFMYYSISVSKKTKIDSYELKINFSVEKKNETYYIMFFDAEIYDLASKRWVKDIIRVDKEIEDLIVEEILNRRKSLVIEAKEKFKQFVLNQNTKVFEIIEI